MVKCPLFIYPQFPTKRYDESVKMNAALFVNPERTSLGSRKRMARGQT